VGLFDFGGNLSHESTSSKNSSGVDDFTRGQLGNIWGAAQGAAAGGPGPLLTGAGQYGTSLQTGGQAGINALSGDPTAVAGLMNPYIQQVLDANNANWQKTNLQTMNQVNDAATRAGAFGGSRQGVTAGVALANNNMAQQTQTANLLNGGYQQAIQQAQALAGFGLQGAQLNSNLGFGGVGNGLWGLNALRSGFIQPTGTFSDTENHGTGYGINGGFGFASK
jgi:hypothetical protein